MKRKCGDCTKCCEGNLSGNALGHSFYPGKPCHFISIGQGCTVYEKRPIEPCVTYKCLWLSDENIPEWFKPNEINAILDTRKIENIDYINVLEAGETLRADVLSWVIMYALNNGLNLRWTIKNGSNYIGSSEFLEVMNRQNLQ